MIRIISGWLLLNLVWTLASFPPLSAQASKAQARSGIDPEITVKIYNSAHVAARDLAKAEAQVGGIFQKAGIKVTWVDDLTTQEAQKHSASQTWNPSSLQLRIWPHSLARPKVIGSDTLGFCISIEEGDAVVLSDEVRNFAQWIRFGDAAIC